MTAKPVEAAFESAANLAILRNAANREPDKHQYYGGCVWCRIDNAEFLGGGAHEHALRLLDLLDAKDRELAEWEQTALNATLAWKREAEQLQAKLEAVTDLVCGVYGELINGAPIERIKADLGKEIAALRLGDDQ